jgi:hypothetical protein
MKVPICCFHKMHRHLPLRKVVKYVYLIKGVALAKAKKPRNNSARKCKAAQNKKKTRVIPILYVHLGLGYMIHTHIHIYIRTHIYVHYYDFNSVLLCLHARVLCYEYTVFSLTKQCVPLNAEPCTPAERPTPTPPPALQYSVSHFR